MHGTCAESITSSRHGLCALNQSANPEAGWYKSCCIEIEVGDIEVTRDFTDVRDVVRAYLALLMQGERGRVYNVGSGAEVRLGDILNRLILLANTPARVIQDPQRMRPAEQRRMRADIRAVQDGTGWRAAFSLDRTLGDILEYWKETLANE